MILKIVICVLIVFSIGEINGKEQYLGKNARLKLINPNYTDITNYPYTACVLKDNKLLGGGVILTLRYVLTAAYNTDGFLPKQLKVRVGSNSPTSGGRMMKVTKITQHPKYDGNWTSDLSLLKLGSNINQNFGTAIPIATSPYTGSASAIVTGFGATKKFRQTMRNGAQLQVATLEMYDYQTCDQEWYGTELSAGEICGFTPGVGPCWSDFGDPVAECDSQGSCTLVGLFAGSYGCADDHFPGIYMDIGYFHDWISNKIGNSL